MLTESLRETLVENAFDVYRGTVQSLAEEFDPLDIAAAAAKLAAEAALGEESQETAEIPVARVAHEREKRKDAASRPAGKGKRDRHEGARGEHGDGSRPPKRRPNADAMTRLVITAGEQRGIRPKDLVGAIAGEADIPGTSIGAIQIGERHSIVEVPESVAEKVIRALSKATLKGQRVTAKREK